MFQRRMFLVASQLRNAQLSPQFRRRKGTQQQQSQEEEDHEDDFDNDVEQQQQQQQQWQQRSTQRSTIDHQLQSIVRLNKKKYRKKLSSLSEGDAAKGQQFAEDATTKTYSIFSKIYKCMKKYRMSISFVLYVGLGTLFYSLDHNNRQSAILGFYQGTYEAWSCPTLAFFGCEVVSHCTFDEDHSLTPFSVHFAYVLFLWLGKNSNHNRV